MERDNTTLQFALQIAQIQGSLQGKLPPATLERLDKLTNLLLDESGYFTPPANVVAIK